MTKEQEAIERLNSLIKVNKDFFENQGDMLIDKRDIQALETVLSMLKEKDKLINEQLKENVSLQKELNEENKRCMILANNDKFKEQIIDLMAEEIAFYQDINSYEDIKTYKKQIKQYLERRVKMNKEKIEEQLKDINFYLRETMWDLRGHLEDLNEVYKIIEEQNTKTIKNIDNFKRELKRDNLYTEELENFINQYMIYYNN